MKTYKDLIEEFIPNHPNRYKLLDALETLEVTKAFESENNNSGAEHYCPTQEEIWESIIPKELHGGQNNFNDLFIDDAVPEVPEEECGYCMNIMTNHCRTCVKGEWHYSDVEITNNFKPYPDVD